MALDMITRARNRKDKVNGAEIRRLSNPADEYTAYEICKLFSGLGCRLSRLDRTLLYNEFADRGMGFTRDDVYFLIASQYTSENIEQDVRRTLLHISSDKKHVSVKQLVHYMIRIGTTFKLSVDQIDLCIKYCYARSAATPEAIRPESLINIDVIVDLVTNG